MRQNQDDDRSLAEQSNEDARSPRQVRPRSIRSWTSRSRTRSRPRSPDTHLHRIYSAAFHDDHGTYVDQDVEHRAAQSQVALSTGGNEDADFEPTSSNEKDEKEEKEGEAQEEVESLYEEPAEDPIKDRSGDNADLEKRTTLSRQTTNKSGRSLRDPNMVSWNGPDDVENPKNWTLKRKWTATFVVSSFTFISPVASAMVAPALPQMAKDLGVTNEVESQMILSIFLLAYAVGPLFLGPLSELYGRVPVLQLANLFFLIFNLVCGFAQTGSQMLVFRFLAGIGGSAPLAIGGGILADCFHPEQRGKAIAIYSLAPLIGPAAVCNPTSYDLPEINLKLTLFQGPIAGGFISQNTTW